MLNVISSFDLFSFDKLSLALLPLTFKVATSIIHLQIILLKIALSYATRLQARSYGLFPIINALFLLLPLKTLAHLVSGFALEGIGMGIAMGLGMRMGMELGVFGCTFK